MTMIDLDALQAFIAASDNVYGLSTGDTIDIFRRLDEAGWQITRKPEPEPVPIEQPTPAPLWSPPGIVALWSQLPNGTLARVTSADQLRGLKDQDVAFAEAENIDDAWKLFMATTGFSISNFTLNGETYSYRTDELPF